MIQSLNEPQLYLERAIGTIKAAARVHERRGNPDKASRLIEVAIGLSGLRDPEAAEFLERRRLRKIQAEMAP